MNEDEQASMAVLRKVKEKGVTLQVAFNRRFDPQFHEVFELVRSGKIGRPQMIKITSRDPDLLPHDLIKRIGGLIFDFTMHDFDMARFMMQDEVSEVYVKGNTLIDPSLKNIDDVDTLAVMLTFRNGGYALIDNSRRAVYGYDQRVEVFGSEGMAYADNVSESTVKVFNSQHCIMKIPFLISRSVIAKLTERKYYTLLIQSCIIRRLSVPAKTHYWPSVSLLPRSNH